MLNLLLKKHKTSVVQKEAIYARWVHLQRSVRYWEWRRGRALVVRDRNMLAIRDNMPATVPPQQKSNSFRKKWAIKSRIGQEFRSVSNAPKPRLHLCKTAYLICSAFSLRRNIAVESLIVVVCVDLTMRADSSSASVFQRHSQHYTELPSNLD